MKHVVLAQPHRRGDKSQLCVSALGRLVLRERVKADDKARWQSIYDAAERYAEVVRLWRAGRGIPTAENHGGGGGGDGPSAKTVKEWERQVNEANRALDEQGHRVRIVTQDLVLLQQDLRWDQEPLAIRGLFALARHFGHIPAKLHPFGGVQDGCLTGFSRRGNS